MLFFKSILKIPCLGILLFVSRQAYADVPFSSMEDDSSLRNTLKESLLAARPEEVLRNRPFIRELPGGSSVQVRVETRPGEFAVILARQWNGSFPGWGQGSWILTRKTNGDYERIRIFPQSDPNTYIQFRPMDNQRNAKSFLDVVLYDACVAWGLPLGVPFENLLTMPLKDILNAAGNKFPLRYFIPEPDRYRDSRELIRKVRTYLPALAYTDDGALDENNRYVFINGLSPQSENGGLNCSGFTKWFVDGMLYPHTGRRLAIPPLKTHTVGVSSSISENFADELDPWFGLDWTRNLALAAARALGSPDTLEEVEVRRGAFAALIDRSRGSAVKSYPGFLVNAGFAVEGLKPLLYTLAVNEPGYIYLASANTELGPQPRMRKHYHDAVIVPYFNEYGVFQTAVFESAAETSLNGFIARHPGRMVNLVRIRAEGTFRPE